MYAEDLHPYDFKQPEPIEGVYMIGWLDIEHEFPQGTVDGKLIDKLWTMVDTMSDHINLHVNVVRGISLCHLCFNEIWQIGKNGNRFPLGMSEIWIPYRKLWYACPSLVMHYIEEHHYLPSSELLVAIREFDLTKHVISQLAYDDAILKRAQRKM